MTVKEYIESGILEMYAMDRCSAEERNDVERMLLKYPDIREELNSIELSLEMIAREEAVVPAAQMRTAVLDAIDQQKSKKVDKEALPLHKITELKSSWNWISVAASVLLLFSVMGNVMLIGKYNSTKGQLIAMQNSSSLMAQELNTTQSNYVASKNLLTMISAPDTKVIPLNGSQISPQSKATIYWCQESDEVYLSVQSLPRPSEQQQYQLWAIVAGKPVDAGMINLMDDTAMIRMKDFESAEAFAITLEKKGGSPTPTLELMYVVGNS